MKTVLLAALFIAREQFITICHCIKRIKPRGNDLEHASWSIERTHKVV
jgi:hypothetical protein